MTLKIKCLLTIWNSVIDLWTTIINLNANNGYLVLDDRGYSEKSGCKCGDEDENEIENENVNENKYDDEIGNLNENKNGVNYQLILSIKIFKNILIKNI